MPAPQVVAKGAGFVADKIKTVARLHGVPIVENKPVARGLFYGVKLGGYIPEKFYLVVA
jgi:flagellar biosynthetic protein FlhB